MGGGSAVRTSLSCGNLDCSQAPASWVHITLKQMRRCCKPPFQALKFLGSACHYVPCGPNKCVSVNPSCVLAWQAVATTMGGSLDEGRNDAIFLAAKLEIDALRRLEGMCPGYPMGDPGGPTTALGLLQEETIAVWAPSRRVVLGRRRLRLGALVLQVLGRISRYADSQSPSSLFLSCSCVLTSTTHQPLLENCTKPLCRVSHRCICGQKK